MKYGRNFIKNSMLSTAIFGFVLSAIPIGTAAATNPQPTRCLSTSPSTWTWSVNRTYPLSQPWCLHLTSEASYLVWQADGNFVWYTKDGIKAKSDTQANTGSRGSGKFLVAQNDGNIVVQDANHKTLWGLNYLNRGNYWKAGSPGDTYTIDLDQGYINSQTTYGTIEYFISGHSTYSSAIAES